MLQLKDKRQLMDVCVGVMIFLGSLVGALCTSCSSSSRCEGRSCIRETLSNQLVTLNCPNQPQSGVIGVNWWFQECSTANNVQVAIDGSGYVQSQNGTQLSITSIQPNDDGSYQCSYIFSEGEGSRQNVACIQVQGRAVFQTCLQENCSVPKEVVHSVMNDFSIDSRVAFVSSGCSNVNQTVNIMKLVHQDRPDEPLFSCANDGTLRGQPCSDSTRVEVTQGQHKYDLRLTLVNISEEDAGIYNLTTETASLSNAASVIIYKTFNLIIVPSASATTASTVTPVVPSTSGLNVTTAPNDATRNYLASLVAVLAIVAIVCFVGVLVGACLVYNRKHSKRHTVVLKTEVPVFMAVEMSKMPEESYCTVTPLDAPSDFTDEYFSMRFDAEVSCTVHIDPPS